MHQRQLQVEGELLLTAFLRNATMKLRTSVKQPERNTKCIMELARALAPRIRSAGSATLADLACPSADASVGITISNYAHGSVERGLLITGTVAVTSGQVAKAIEQFRANETVTTSNTTNTTSDGSVVPKHSNDWDDASKAVFEMELFLPVFSSSPYPFRIRLSEHKSWRVAPHVYLSGLHVFVSVKGPKIVAVGTSGGEDLHIEFKSGLMLVLPPPAKPIALGVAIVVDGVRVLLHGETVVVWDKPFGLPYLVVPRMTVDVDVYNRTVQNVTARGLMQIAKGNRVVTAEMLTSFTPDFARYYTVGSLEGADQLTQIIQLGIKSTEADTRALLENELSVSPTQLKQRAKISIALANYNANPWRKGLTVQFDATLVHGPIYEAVSSVLRTAENKSMSATLQLYVSVFHDDPWVDVMATLRATWALHSRVHLTSIKAELRHTDNGQHKDITLQTGWSFFLPRNREPLRVDTGVTWRTGAKEMVMYGRQQGSYQPFNLTWLTLKDVELEVVFCTDTSSCVSKAPDPTHGKTPEFAAITPSADKPTTSSVNSGSFFKHVLMRGTIRLNMGAGQPMVELRGGMSADLEKVHVSLLGLSLSEAGKSLFSVVGVLAGENSTVEVQSESSTKILQDLNCPEGASLDLHLTNSARKDPTITEVVEPGVTIIGKASPAGGLMKSLGVFGPEVDTMPYETGVFLPVVDHAWDGFGFWMSGGGFPITEDVKFVGIRISFSAPGGSAQISVSSGVSVNVPGRLPQHRAQLVFVARATFKVTVGSVILSGSMLGTWYNPFGLRGFQISNLVVSIGLNPSLCHIGCISEVGMGGTFGFPLQSRNSTILFALYGKISLPDFTDFYLQSGIMAVDNKGNRVPAILFRDIAAYWNKLSDSNLDLEVIPENWGIEAFALKFATKNGYIGAIKYHAGLQLYGRIRMFGVGVHAHVRTYGETGAPDFCMAFVFDFEELCDMLHKELDKMLPSFLRKSLDVCVDKFSITDFCFKRLIKGYLPRLKIEITLFGTKKTFEFQVNIFDMIRSFKDWFMSKLRPLLEIDWSRTCVTSSKCQSKFGPSYQCDHRPLPWSCVPFCDPEAGYRSVLNYGCVKCFFDSDCDWEGSAGPTCVGSGFFPPRYGKCGHK